MSHELHELRRWLEHKESEMKEWLNDHFGNINKPRHWTGVIIIRPLEPIKKDEEKIMDPLDIGQVPLGQRRPVDFVPDEAVDLNAAGDYATSTVVDGDSTANVAPGSTAKSFRVYFNGDGAVGKKSADVAVDGHVGDGDVEVVQRVLWEVTSPDATTFTNAPAPLEAIPTTPPPPTGAPRR